MKKIQDKITIILVEPQMGENIGAVARIMKNFGFSRLALISPREGWLTDQTLAMSAGADYIIHNAKIGTYEEIFADINFSYATTRRIRYLNKEVVESSALRPDIAPLLESDAQIGIVFGGERSGLNNEQISLSNKILTIAVDEIHGSLNLAQAVCVILYELARGVFKIEQKPQILAKSVEIQMFIEDLEQELDKAGFYGVPEKAPSMKNNIRAIFRRIPNLSESEINTLRGVVTYLTRRNKKSAKE